MITFNQPVVTGKEIDYINEVIKSKKLSGNYDFTKKCQTYFELRYNVSKVLLTTSCTDALEMSALLCDIKNGDEVIMPSYTFVSTANAFALRGANIKFVDSLPNHPNMDTSQIESLISSRTKVIVVVHYAGNAVQMETILDIAKRYDLIVVEDAAQAIESSYIFKDGTSKQLGTIGDLGTFSFHETKNLTSGEGGALLINNEDFTERAEIIWEKGTNRASFSRGEINKYGWVDLGSSFLPSELNAAFLYAQLEYLEKITQKRKKIHDIYKAKISKLELKKHALFPDTPKNSTENGHIFCLICISKTERTELIKHLADKNIKAVFHYLALHQSEFFKDKFKGDKELENAIKFENTLLRLPIFNDLSEDSITYICQAIKQFYERQRNYC